MNKKIDSRFSENALKRKNRITCKNGKVESFAKISSNTGIQVDTLKRIFSGKRSPKLSEAYAIADALNTTTNNLTNSKEQIYLKTTIRKWAMICEKRTRHTSDLIKSLEQMQECDREAQDLWKTFEQKFE